MFGFLVPHTMELKFTDVVYVSSEDPLHPASALLHNEKWLSVPGSKHSHIEVVLQLSEASQISSIHIGNCGSAYVSVLVAKKGSSMFTSLLPQSTFMSVLDCKLSKNKTQVRMFNQNDFLPEARDDSWSQVKVMCCQPFNMLVQYGVSFVRVFSVSEARPDIEDPSPSNWQTFKRLSSQLAAGNDTSNNSGGLLSRSERLILQSAKMHNMPGKREFQSNSPREQVSASTASEVLVSRDNVAVEEDDDIFKAKAVSFLDTLELHKKSLQNIELGHVTREFETTIGHELTVEIKGSFTQILRMYLKSLKKLQVEQKSSSPNSSSKSPSNLHCKTPGSQERCRHERRTSSDLGNTPRKIVVKSCSPGWLHNMVKPSASSLDVEDHAADAAVSPVKRSGHSNGVPSDEHEMSGNSGITGLTPRMRRNRVSLEEVDDDTVGPPSRSNILSPTSDKLKRARSSSVLPPEDSPKKFCEPVDTDDCQFVASVVRNRDTTVDELIECPICSRFFDTSEIQHHAESCESYVEADRKNTVKCPLCSKEVNKDEVRSHADSCARKMFGD